MSTERRIMLISTHGYVSSHVEFGKPDTGGQVVYILELAKCMARFGYHVDILTRRFEDQDEFEKVEDHVEIVRIPCGGNKWIPKETLCNHINEWCENAKEKLAELGRQYAFVSSHYWDAGLAGMDLAHSLGIAHLFTPHSIGAWKRDNMDGSPEALEKQYNFKRRIKEERIIFHDCNAVIATTPQQREILRAEEYGVPSKKISVIPPGYDDTRYFPVSDATRKAIKSEYGFDGRIVLALGRIARNKGYDLLIKAMKYVCERHEDVKLLLAIGSSEPSEAEQAMVLQYKNLADELGIGDRVIFQNYIPDEQMPDHYRLADVFALSSRYEPFGMTAVEAMACGTPAVVTTEGGLWEKLEFGQDGLYANPFDPFEYGAALNQVLRHPEIAEKLKKNGSHLARAEFTWIGIAQQVIRLAKQPSMNRSRPAKSEDAVTA